ncbi:MAG: hypothetical protein FP820_09175 [Sulfurimonas sp.]|nr:hypothetical protein [Sulfurimonas sp.]MBU3938321.1 hypothetical protein [bacterium]MBU4025123.1 hypothetical protein [bacterium]MBU4057953.1 hypothetical protein [bacterium]MBU4111652.1 hypothetical protein [bacterium]
MFTKFNSKYRTIFVDPQMPRVEISEKVNVILSPSLYWVKKLSLPIKYLRDVKKILPSIFEDVLPEGNYNYSAYKSGEEFFVFAYEDKLILDTLAQKGINASNIANVYFAQSEFEELEGALKVNETQNMYLKDEILILVPNTFVNESKPLDADTVSLSGHTISLAQFGHIVDTKSLYKIAGVFIVLIVLLGVEWFVTAQKINEIEELKSALFEKEGAKSTMFENNAILKKQKAIYEKQTKLRDGVSLVLSAKLAKNETLKEVSLKNKSFVAEFSTLSPATTAAIEKDFKASGLSYKISKQNESWRVEVSL